MIPYKNLSSPHNPLRVLKGKVTNIVEHERTTVNNRTGATESFSRWHELTLQSQSGDFKTVSGDVVRGARVDDDIALVIDPSSSGTVCLVNFDTDQIFLDSSANPDMPRGTGIIFASIALAAVLALPGFLVFHVVVGGLISLLGIHSVEELGGPLFRTYPFVLLPVCWYIWKRLDEHWRERARALYKKVQIALHVADIEVKSKPIVF